MVDYICMFEETEKTRYQKSYLLPVLHNKIDSLGVFTIKDSS